MSFQCTLDCMCLQEPAHHKQVTVILTNSAAGKPSEPVAVASAVLQLLPVATAAAAAVRISLLTSDSTIWPESMH